MKTFDGINWTGSDDYEYNAKDFGAKGDGVTDDTVAILSAIGSGGRKVRFPAGTYRMSSTLTIPSMTEIYGDGIDRTIFKFTENAPVAVWGMTNRDRNTGNQYIHLHDFTMDWNLARTGSTAVPSAGGGSNASGITFGNVQYGRIERVKSINPGLHSFDVTCASIAYPYEGDGAPRPAGPSQYIWIENCEAANWGDDGFTTHHSEYIFISNCYAHDPRLKGNNNGIEIDDGSRHVFLTNNMSENCYAGIEIKAHETASAAQDVHINGHLSKGDVRSYNWRHIGHHTGTDPVSKTAFDITASDLVSLWPSNVKGYQDDATPRSLCISAYGRVSVTNFTAIADPTYDYKGFASAAIQYRAHDVTITGFNAYGFKNADSDLYIGNGTDKISIFGYHVKNSAMRGMQIADAETRVSLNGLNIEGTTGAQYGIDAGYHRDRSNLYISPDAQISNYPTKIRAWTTNFSETWQFMNAAVPIPDGTTSMKTLYKEDAYYLSTAQFTSMGTDRPAGASGGYILYNEPATTSGDSRVQRIIRNTSSSDLSHYIRFWYSPTSASDWFQVNQTRTAYSTS